MEDKRDKKELKIALVLTAGSLKEVYNRRERRLPFWLHWPLFKGRVKKLEHKEEIKIVYREELKGETIARLDKVLRLFTSCEIDLIACTGGYSPKRKRLKLKDSVEMMNHWLSFRGVGKETILGGEATSVDTGTNIREFLERLKRIESPQKITIYLVTSWYHLFRGKIELKKALIRAGIKATIFCIPVFPKWEAETLKYEYVWNILTEPLKLFSLPFPTIKYWWEKRELEMRK